MDTDLEYEVWENQSAGIVYVHVTDPINPNLRPDRMIPPGGRVSITTRDRRINQQQIVDRAFDMFINGLLTPVQLVETASDFEEIKSQPNVKSESELKELFDLTAAKFKTELQGLTNTRILQRMHDMAEQDEVKATHSQVKAIEARIDELAPDLAAARNLGDQTGEIKAKPLS